MLLNYIIGQEDERGLEQVDESDCGIFKELL